MLDPPPPKCFSSYGLVREYNYATPIGGFGIVIKKKCNNFNDFKLRILKSRLNAIEISIATVISATLHRPMGSRVINQSSNLSLLLVTRMSRATIIVQSKNFLCSLLFGYHVIKRLGHGHNRPDRYRRQLLW
jgi:hypothetical protein